MVLAAIFNDDNKSTLENKRKRTKKGHSPSMLVPVLDDLNEIAKKGKFYCNWRGGLFIQSLRFLRSSRYCPNPQPITYERTQEPLSLPTLSFRRSQRGSGALLQMEPKV